ncbi:MAG: HAD family hydrolase [Candidatus Helarchaeota archaeon]
MLKGIAFDLQFTLVFLEDFTLTKWFKLFDQGLSKVLDYLKADLNLTFDEKKFYRTLRRIRNRYFAKAVTAEDQQYFTEEIFRDTFSKMNMNIEEISQAELEHIYELYHSVEIPAWKPKPNLKYVIEQLSKNYKLFIITNGSERVARAILKLQDIYDFFEYSFYNARKPRLDAFKKYREMMNCRYKELAMVGDDINTDIRPALKLGIIAIQLYRGYEYLKHHANVKIKPDKRINNLEELLEVVKIEE